MPDNQPVNQAPKAPQPPAQKTPNLVSPNKQSKLGLLLVFSGIFLVLFVLFLVFLVVLLAQNGGNNPVLQALGVEPALLRQLLSTLISLVFGFLSLVSFIVMAVGLFRRLTSTKVELEKKKKSLIMAGVAGLLFLTFVFVWMLLFFYISRLQLSSQGAKVILSEPANTTNLSAPIDITFSAMEIERLYLREGVVSYSWDLDGDGAFDDGNGRDRQYRYDDLGKSGGNFLVSVKVILGTGQELVAQKSVTIANIRPRISIEYSPDVLEVPVELSFDASRSVDPDGSIISYDWDFNGDEVIDVQGARASWNFTEPVSQTIRLSVTDSNGEQVVEELDLDFTKGRERKAVITARPGLAGAAPFQIFLDGSDSYVGGLSQSFEWRFGDNSPVGKGRQVQHVYERPGQYTIELTVTSADGKAYRTEGQIAVEAPKRFPTAVIEAKDAKKNKDGVVEGEAPFTIQFDASKSTDPDGSVVEYRWDFDADGKDDDFGETVEYTFVEAGAHAVQLTVVDDQGLESIQMLTVQVSLANLLLDLVTDTVSGPAPLTVTFDASRSRATQGKIISYRWNFGDDTGELLGSARQTHVYDRVGEFTAKVTVATESGERASKEQLIAVREIELQAQFTVNPEERGAGDKIFFDASGSQGQISRYYWEFGDGAFAYTVKPDHIYEIPGTYQVTLEVYDRRNRVSKTIQEIVIEP